MTGSGRALPTKVGTGPGSRLSWFCWRGSAGDEDRVGVEPEVGPGVGVADDVLLEEAARHVARYKLPKAFVRVPLVVRSPSGKADYTWAKQQAASGA